MVAIIVINHDTTLISDDINHGGGQEVRGGAGEDYEELTARIMSRSKTGAANSILGNGRNHRLL